MSHGTMKALYCEINHDASLYTVHYHAYTANGLSYQSPKKTGYSLDVFRDLPGNTPVVDLTTADTGKVIKLILNVDGIEEHSGPARMYYNPIPFAEWLERMRATGATVGTLESMKVN